MKTVSRSDEEDVLCQLMKLAWRILQDKPQMELSHLAAEVLRATVGVGDYALPMPQPRSVREMMGKPVKRKPEPAQGRLL